MLNLKKTISLLALLCLHIQIYSQVFNSEDYKIAQEFFYENPKKLKFFVEQIDLDTYGKCFTVVNEWEAALFNKQVNLSKSVKQNLAAQWVGLAEARRKLMSQGVSDSTLVSYTRSYRNRNDVMNGGVNFNEWSLYCAKIASNAINY